VNISYDDGLARPTPRFLFTCLDSKKIIQHFLNEFPGCEIPVRSQNRWSRVYVQGEDHVAQWGASIGFSVTLRALLDLVRCIGEVVSGWYCIFNGLWEKQGHIRVRGLRWRESHLDKTKNGR